jgi:hypothetical protein
MNARESSTNRQDIMRKAAAWMQAMGCKGNHIARGSGVLEFKESARQANLKELSGDE